MSETIKIRVQRDDVILNVNDNEDTIVLPVSDERFTQKILEFAKTISTKAEELSKSAPTDPIDLAIMNVKFHEFLKDEFNVLFGDRAYEKVFGDDSVVGAEYVLDFLDQCMPFLEKHNLETAEKFKKYSADRVGSSL